MAPWPAQRKQPGGSPDSAIFQLGTRVSSDRPGCRAAALGLLPVIRVHDWTPIEQIGHVVTYRCECGKTKTRVEGSPGLDRSQDGSPSDPVGPAAPGEATPAAAAQDLPRPEREDPRRGRAAS